MTRTCGDCQLCCKLLPVPALRKAADQRCKHQKTGVGCKIYRQPYRPAACQLWSCVWLTCPEMNTSRPDRAHYVVDPTPDFVIIEGKRVMALQVWIDPGYPDAHRDFALRWWVETLRKDIVVVARFGSDRVITLIPPHMSAERIWMEIESRVMDPKMAGEARREMIEERINEAQKAGDPDNHADIHRVEGPADPVPADAGPDGEPEAEPVKEET